MIKSASSSKAARVVAGIVLLTVCSSAGAADFMTPEYARGEFRPRSMVLIPPLAEVTKDKVSSTEQMIEAGSVLEDAATLALQTQLEELGYAVRVLRPDEVNASPELQRMVRNLNSRYDTDRVQIVNKPKDIRSRRFNLGDEARILAAHLNAEAIVIARIFASGATGGQQTMAVLFGGSLGYASLSIGIVAGDNGDLEAYFDGINGAVSANKLEAEPREIMADVSGKALKKFPAVGGTAKVSRSWPQNTHRKAPEAAASDDAVLSDLEVLFGVGEDQETPISDQELPADE